MPFQTPALLPFPDLTEPQTAYPLYAQRGVDEKYIARMENVYLQVIELLMHILSLAASGSRRLHQTDFAAEQVTRHIILQMLMILYGRLAEPASG